MFVQLIIAFNLGLFSTLHCVGMCGGILSAMMISGDADKTDKHNNKIIRSLAYNLGRITSYAIAGLIAGLIGEKIIHLVSDLNLHIVLQTIAALVLIGIALNIMGVLPFNRYLEMMGSRIWKQIQPLGKHLLPVNSHSRGFMFGMLWGWLPCGMVYSALILSLSSGSPIYGMLVMLFFGLGTLPGMVSAGYFSGKLIELQKNRQLRILTALLLIFIAVSLPISSVYFSKHHDHSGAASTDHSHHHMH